MHLRYNGVDLELLTIDRAERRSVLTPDETTVLYTEWSLSVSCVYHPMQGDGLGGTSINFVSSGDRNPPAKPATPLGLIPSATPITMPGVEGPIRSDRELYQYLSVPRKPLYIWAYDNDGPVIWLQSPRPGANGEPMKRDAKTGPIVQANITTATLGQGQTFGVQMEIKTWVPPCPFGSDRLILGHRWQMVHGHDENNFLTRSTTGYIWFNGGVLDEFEMRPDVVGKQLFHPIPLGFRRYIDQITPSPDHLVLRYTFHDVDQKVVFDPGVTGATTIAVSENVQYRVPFQGQERLMDAARNLVIPYLFPWIGASNTLSDMSSLEK